MYTNEKISINMKDISILYIDDEEHTIELIFHDLKKSVHKITLARTKKQAMKKFVSKRFDLVIIALDAGRINGFKILKQLRKIEPDIHAIILLEDGSKEYAKGMSEINILNDFISKTQDINILNKLVRKSIKKIINRRDFKEVYALLGHYKVALDESWIVVKTNLDGIITYVNNNFCKVSKYTKEEVLGKNLDILRSSNQRDEDFDKLWKCIRDKQVFKSELKYTKKDGHFFFVNSTVIPVLNSHNEIIETISISFDITQLKNSLKRAQDAKKSKSNFLANMSHDIRIPLNGILGFSRLLKNNNLSKNIELEYIDIINNSASSLLGIINEILDISKIESGKLKLENNFFDASYEFEVITELFSSLANEKDIDYILFLDPKLPKKLYGDVIRIKQIISNLISNAIKFTPNNGQIIVEIKVLDLSDTCTYEVCIIDSGIGIAKENQESIFRPFEQANSTTFKKFGGTGLGLSISYNVLELMNSKIQLQSQINKGSNFSFILNSKYEKEDIVYDKNVKKQKILLFTQNEETISKHILIAQKYISAYANTHIEEDLNQIQNYDVLVLMYTDFIQYPKEYFVKPTIIIHNENLENIHLNTKFKLLKTPINPAKTYDSILDVLGIENSNSNLLQKKLRNENTLFSGNVLVAEDDETNQQLIQILLESKGITVNMVSNGEKAVDYITNLHQDSSIDFILMDINMPIIDGINATKEIKKFESKNNVKHTPVVAFTANAITGDKEKYLRLGMDNYLSKPIKYPDLYNILDEYLKRSTPLIHDTPSNESKNNTKKEKIMNKLDYSIDDSAKLIGISSEKFSVIFEKFVTNLEAKLELLKSHIEQGNKEELTRSAHSLKGASANMNVTCMSVLFKHIELTSKQDKSISYKKELQEIEDIHTQLQHILKNSKIS